LPRETTKKVTVMVNGDTAVENDEKFLLELAQPNGARILKAQGVGTILNDDRVATAPIESDPADPVNNKEEDHVGSDATKQQREAVDGSSTSPPGQTQTSVQQAQSQSQAPQTETAGQAQNQLQPQAQPQPQGAAASQTHVQQAPQVQIATQAQPATMLERQREIEIKTAKLTNGDGGQTLLASARPISGPMAGGFSVASVSVALLCCFLGLHKRKTLVQPLALSTQCPKKGPRRRARR